MPKQWICRWHSVFRNPGRRPSCGVTHLGFRNDVAVGAQAFKDLVRKLDGGSWYEIGVRIENRFKAGEEGAIVSVGQVQGECD